MKSSSVGRSDGRRLAVLAELAQLDVCSYTMAIHKQTLHKDSGLKYKRSFYKYLNRWVYERIVRLHPGATLVVDEHGSPAFMKEVQSYIESRMPSELFPDYRLRFAKSSDEIMLQVADMVSGSWARVLDPDKKSKNGGQILQTLQKISVGVESWPISSQPGPGNRASTHSVRDEMIRAHCIEQARHFLERPNADADDDEEHHAQEQVLHYLLYSVRFVDPQEYVSSRRLIRALSNRGLALGERKLRAAVSGLRDRGVIIGNSSKGYKIPVCGDDLRHFVSHTNSIVPPMLRRLYRARLDLRAVSLGSIDILDGSEFRDLRRLVESLDEGGA